MKLNATFLLSFCILFGASKAANDECPPGSLDNLNFTELFKKSDIPDCLEESRRVFGEKYNTTIFVFGGEHAMTEQRPFVFINDNNLIKKTLDKFGDLILGPIRFYFSSLNNGKEMLEYVSDKCSKTLQKMEIDDCFGTLLDGLKNTFDSVTDMKFRNSIIVNIDVNSDSSHKMSKFFPNLESLKLDSLRTPSWRFVFGEFPKLKKLFIESNWNSVPDTVNESHFAKYFQANSRIESLRVKECNFKLLRMAKDHLPQLKVLELDRPTGTKYEGNQIEFKNVNEFSLRLEKEIDLLDKIVFNLKLEKLTLDVPSDLTSTNKWFEFLINQNLTHLNLKYKILTNQQFTEISTAQRRLQSVDIECDSKFTALEIINFMENCTEINHFKLVAHMDKEHQVELEKVLGEKWKVMCLNLSSNPKVHIEINPKKPESGSGGGGQSLVMSHFVHVFAPIAIWMTLKLY